jgi:tight adherence protein B
VGTPQIILIAFGSIAVVAWAGALVLRDLFFPQQVPAAANSPTGSRRARRAPTVFDQSPAQGLLGKVDQGFDRLVLETGYEMSPGVAFALCACVAIAAGGGVYLAIDDPLAGVGGGLAGLFLPLALLAVRRARRIREIREQLPYTLDMLARATRAGQSVEQAIRLVGEEGSGALRAEFRRCSQQLDMGRAFDKVLMSLAGRVRLIELRILATTLIVQRQTGGPLSETLERMASVIHDRLNAQRQIKASTGAGRTSTLIIAAIAPMAYAFMFLFHRSHIQFLFDDGFGRLLLWGALMLELAGLVWVFFLLRKEE